LAQPPDADASVEASLNTAAALAARAYILRDPAAADPESRAKLAEEFRRASEGTGGSWSALVNYHWACTVRGDDKGAAWASEEAARRGIISPFAAAYFARESHRRGDPAGALAWVEGADFATDSATQLELTLAAMHAHAARGDMPSLMRAYARRIREADGTSDKQHVIQHLAHAAEQLPEEIRRRLDPGLVEAELRALLRDDPGEIAHVWALALWAWSLGRPEEALKTLLDSAERFRTTEAYREYFVHAAWRLLANADPARPN